MVQNSHLFVRCAIAAVFVLAVVQTRSTRADERSDSHQTAAEPNTNDASAAQEPAELSPLLIQVRDRVRWCLQYYYNRPANAASRSAWGLMHTVISFGVDTPVIADGRRQNALSWMCWNGRCQGSQLLYTSNGLPYAYNAIGLQGHEGQFLAVLAQSRLQQDYPMRVNGRRLTVADLVKQEQLTCRAGTELTFKLIGLSHYLESNAKWKCQAGEDWSIPRLIREELDQPVIGAACGGTHRLMGYSYAVYKRRQRGEPVAGQWQRAQTYVDDYIDYAFRLQNQDGGFSTNWFAGRGDWGGAEHRLDTTGHTLEWLVFAMPEERLTDKATIRAVVYLSNLLIDNRRQEWGHGPRGHALHALAMYDERVFGSTPGQRSWLYLREGETEDDNTVSVSTDGHDR